jgi:hypothetical protein
VDPDGNAMAIGMDLVYERRRGVVVALLATGSLWYSADVDADM